VNLRAAASALAVAAFAAAPLGAARAQTPGAVAPRLEVLPTRTPTPAPPPTAQPTPAPTATPSPAPAATPSSMPGGPAVGVFVALVAAAAGVGAAFAGVVAVLVVRRRRLRRKDEMHRLEIVAPRDASIAVAGKPVVFGARTDPPQLASRVRWSVSTQPGEPGANGVGGSFSYTFSATGVEQVVAHLDDDRLTCDVIVYVFETRGGGSTLADLLRAEPPPVARDPASLRRWGTSASTARAAS
jgi:hypothetical protein